MTNRRRWTQQAWILLGAVDIATERKQAEEEGRDLSSVEAEFDAVQQLELNSEADWQRAEALLDAVQELPLVDGYAYEEPSDLKGIKAARPRAGMPAPRDGALSPAELRDKALGAWQGRASGCLLGKPVEGRRSWGIRKYLESQGRWPLDRYFSNNVDPAVAQECGFDIRRDGLYEEGITCMPEDDDTNYTATGLALVKQSGKSFRPEHAAGLWLTNIPYIHVCTAERIAYKNLASGIGPPESASHRNPYREWIGAQIRADFFGYVCPGDPELAAELAWRDACISHVKNGIYGEMWVAAMLAAAYVCDDVKTVIRAGLGQIPAKCRLTENIETIIALRESGASFDEAIADVRTRWNEDSAHDWCHTISNAEVCAVSLLWGDLDFEKSICMSVKIGRAHV